MKYLSKFLLPGLALYAILLGFICIYNDYSLSALLPLAPIVYGLIFALVYSRKRNAFNSIVVLIVFAIWFLRMVLIPCIYVMSGYSSNIQTGAGTENLNFAVLLVCYEFVATGFYIVLSKRISVISETSQSDVVEYSDRTKVFVRIAVVTIGAIAVACVLMNKSMLATISTVYEKLSGSTEDAIQRRRDYLAARNSSKMIFHLFTNVVYYLQILIPACLITYVINKKNSIGSTKRGFLLCILVAASSALITTENNIDSVCIMVACMLVIFINYRSIIANKAPLMICMAGVFIAYFLFSKAGTDTSSENALASTSATLCSYFSAIPNVSAGLAMKFSDRLSTFLGDIISGIPYMAAFFKGYPTSITIYNEIVHGYTGIVNQIVPLIVSGYHFLGPLAPMLTITTYNIAIRMELRMRKTHMVLNQVLFAVFCVNLAIGPCIFGFPNTIKRLCHFMPLFIFSVFAEKQRTKRNRYDGSKDYISSKE